MSQLKQKDKGSVWIAVVVSGSMALALGLGLELLKILDLINNWILQKLTFTGTSPPEAGFSDGFYWITSGLTALILSTVILMTNSNWRRSIIWIISLALTLSWAPVLLLAGMKPEIGLVLVSVFWSGACAMLYARNHLMPADEIPSDR